MADHPDCPACGEESDYTSLGEFPVEYRRCVNGDCWVEVFDPEKATATDDPVVSPDVLSATGSSTPTFDAVIGTLLPLYNVLILGLIAAMVGSAATTAVIGTTTTPAATDLLLVAGLGVTIILFAALAVSAALDITRKVWG